MKTNQEKENTKHEQQQLRRITVSVIYCSRVEREVELDKLHRFFYHMVEQCIKLEIKRPRNSGECSARREGK